MSSERRRALLLDDDLGGRLGFVALLEDAGYAVMEAGSLAEARALLSGAPLDIAVLDVELPDGKGPQLIPELVARHPAVAVVVMSGHDGHGGANVHAWLTKGDAPAQQLRKISEALRKATGARP